MNVTYIYVTYIYVTYIYVTYINVTNINQHTVTYKGCRRSSVDFSVPTILLPWVQVPSTPTTLSSFIVTFGLNLSSEKNENKQKEAGYGPFKKNTVTVSPELLRPVQLIVTQFFQKLPNRGHSRLANGCNAN